MKIFERKRRNRPILKKWSKTSTVVFEDSLRGRPAWTNCQAAFIGPLPRHWKCCGDVKGSIDAICPPDDSPMIQPVEVVEDVFLNHQATGEAVRFDSDAAINAAYYDELVRVGGVTWRQSKVRGVIRADDADGQPVGIVMPLTAPLRRDS